MLAGPLDRRITLRRSAAVPNAANEDTLTWSDLVTVWASHQPLSDGERRSADQTVAAISDRFQIRASSEVADLNAGDQVLFDGRLYDITGVKPLGRRVGLEISASALADL